MQGRLINAEVAPAGSYLASLASATDTSIVLTDVTPFIDSGQVRLTAGATSEVIAYTAVNRDTKTLTLAAGLANGYAAGSEVRVYPAKEPRYVWARLTDGRAVRAHLPFVYRDRVRLGARSEAPDGPQGERVEVNLAGPEPRVTNMPDETPDISGAFLTPGSIPASSLTDGAAPESSPTPTVQGGLGWLAIKWPGVTNDDPVTYEIHVSTTGGFAHSASTKAAETPGTVAFIRRLQNETPLAYDTDYYVKLVARDGDGEASPSTQVGPTRLAVVTGPDIAADAVTANHILAGSITAEHLGAVVLEATKIYSPAQTGDRLEIGDPTFPLRYWDGTTVRFSVDNLGNVLAFQTDLSESHIRDFAEFHEQMDSPIVRQSGADASATGLGGVSATWGEATDEGNLLVAVVVSHEVAGTTSNSTGPAPGEWQQLEVDFGPDVNIIVYYIPNAASRSGSEGPFQPMSWFDTQGSALTLGPGAAVDGTDARLEYGEYAKVAAATPANLGLAKIHAHTQIISGTSPQYKLEIIRTDTSAVVAEATRSVGGGDHPELEFTPIASVTYDYKVTNLTPGSVIDVDLIATQYASPTVVHLLSYSGISAPNPRDVTAETEGTSTTASTGTTASTAQDEELAIAVIAHEEDAARSGSPSNSFTFIQTASSGSGATHVEGHVYEKILSAAGTQNMTQELTASKKWVGLIVTLKGLTAEPQTPEAGAIRVYATADEYGDGGVVLKAKDEDGNVEYITGGPGFSGAKIYQQQASSDLGNTEVWITGANQVSYDTDGYYVSGGRFLVPRDGIYDVTVHLTTSASGGEYFLGRILRGDVNMNAISTATEQLAELHRDTYTVDNGEPYMSLNVVARGVILLEDDYIIFTARSPDALLGGEQHINMEIRYLGPLPAFTDPSSLSPLMWFEANDLDATLANDDPVGTWPDKSGNGHDMTQGTSGAKPTFKTSVVSGEDVVRFDGTSDYLDIPNVLTGLTEGEVMIVVKANADPGSGSASGLWQLGSTGGGYSHYSHSDGELYEGFGSTVRKSGGNPARALTSWNVYGAWSRSADWAIWLNTPTGWTGNAAGFIQYHTSTNTVGWTTAPTLGKTPSQFWPGDVAELIIFDRKLTQVERWQMSRYLRAKYAIV